MATHLDLEEQEQLDQLKAFWKQYGNLITWVVILALAVFAGFGGWKWWKADQSGKAGVLYDELEHAAVAGDAEKATRVFSDMRDRYGRTAFAEQAGLLAAKVQVEKGQSDAARASLQWVVDHASEKEYQAVARLRLAGLLMDLKQFDEAGKVLTAEFPKEFAALADDRRGDLLMTQGKKAEAVSAYQKAYAAMDAKVDYRKLLSTKLTVLGAPPAPDASEAAASGTQP